MLTLLVIICVLTLIATNIWLTLERGLLPKRSTREFWRLSKLPLPKKIEGYIYAARTSSYLKPASLPRFLAMSKGRESAETYHAKTLTAGDAMKLIIVDEPVNMTDLEHVIPYAQARDIVLSGTQDVAVLQCPCREQKKDACEPRDVCLIVGEPYVGFVVDHQPDKARRISVLEALKIIDAEE